MCFTEKDDKCIKETVPERVTEEERVERRDTKETSEKDVREREMKMQKGMREEASEKDR